MRYHAYSELSRFYWGLRHQPQDPVWACDSVLAKVREALRAYDPYLTMWWSRTRHCATDTERPGRWRLVRFERGQGPWVTVFYWEGAQGQYRDPDAVDAILARLKLCDRPTDQVQKEIDERNDKIARAARAEKLAEFREGVLDYTKRYMGVRQTFGPGYIRSRKFYRPGILLPKL